jgi:hypothetical protein
MISSFWLLRAPRTQPLVEETPDTKSERITCPAHEGHKRGGKRLGELSVIAHPNGIKDFTWTWLNDVLVSPRVVDLFDKHRVTGFEVMNARVFYPETIKAVPPEMLELVVTGWGGFAASAAGVTLAKWCPACEHKLYAIAEPSRLIDPAAWDGSDLFIVWPLPGYRFVSDRLASILRQERVSGIELISPARIPTKRGARVGPGTLTSSMPEHRAQELDRRFDVSHWLVEEHHARSLGAKHS